MSLNAGQLFLSSYNNQDNETSTDFSLTLSVPVTKAKKIRMLSATIPNLFMPFANNDRSWVFALKIGASAPASYQVIFPTNRRWATIADFVSFCNTTLFPSGTTYPVIIPTAVPVTMSYDPNTNKLTLTAAAGITIVMPPWNWNNTEGTSVSYNANYRLGWTSSRPVSGVTTLTADGFPNVFNRANVLYVVTNLSATSNNDNNVANIIGRIPVNIGWGGVINYENLHLDFEQDIFVPNFKELRIQLLDEDYQPVTQATNAYFSLTLGVKYDEDKTK
jgi:hypothetical protein